MQKRFWKECTLSMTQCNHLKINNIQSKKTETGSNEKTINISFLAITYFIYLQPDHTQ